MSTQISRNNLADASSLQSRVTRVSNPRLSRHVNLYRLASAGLVAVLVTVPGLALWAAVSTHEAGLRATHALEVRDSFEVARYAVASEESLERKYRLEPSDEVRAAHAQAAATVSDSLIHAARLGVDPGLLRNMLSAHAGYLKAIDRMFKAIDAGNPGLTTEIDEQEADPAFEQIQAEILAEADQSRAVARATMGEQSHIQAMVLLATPIVFVLSGIFVLFFWRVLKGYRANAARSAMREAAAGQQREQRFRSLVQNTSDVILICDAQGQIGYQSPAAETLWGYGGAALQGRSLDTLVSPEDQPALRELWKQVREDTSTRTAGTRSTELQMQDSESRWRYVQLILTNLLREPAVNGVVVTIRDISERKIFEQQLMQQAFYDALTNLPNRALFRDRLRQALVRSERRASRVGLLFIDLDNFKLINDSLGHDVGDDVLVEMAARLKSCMRAEDTLARLGGDEFVVVLEDVTSEADSKPVADVIMQQFRRPLKIGTRELLVTASVGLAISEGGPALADSLLRNADIAMYRAKSDGKARNVTFNASMQFDSLARLELESDLRGAIAGGELRVYYQPIVVMGCGDVCEVEALVRWQHPTRGLLLPATFISIAEETGLVVPLGHWVLHEACRQVAAWHASRPEHPKLTLSVNLSPRQFQLPNLAEDVAETLRETGMPAQYLKLEITEGVIMRDVEGTIDILGRLKQLGVKIAVDDFGTGYSSLAYLKRLPLDVLKIDRAFISGIGHDKEDRAIVRAIISLAKSLDLAVTGEGIETPEQAELLDAWGCDRGQGYHYGKPLDHTATENLLNAVGAVAIRIQA